MSRNSPSTQYKRNQRGASLVLVTVALTGLLGFFALAIDLGHFMVIRNELQNAADSAALSGANSVYPEVSNTPDFSSANSKAVSSISLNSAANTVLASGDTATGYWNITGSPTGLHTSQVANDLPAVQVIIRKSGAQNGGGVATFFAGVLGINSLDGAAVAVAVAGASPSFTSKSMFPVAISQCMYNNYWDSLTNQPKGGSPITFTIGSTDGFCGSEVAQWALLGSTGTITDLINNVGLVKLSPKISIGDTLIITPPNSADSLTYSNSANMCAGVNSPCDYVLVPVVAGSLASTAPLAIVGFACIHIISAAVGTPTVTLQMASIDNTLACKMSDSGGNGPAYGAAIPPKLVNYYGNP